MKANLRCSFKDVDIALFSAGGSISKKFAHVASDAGATVQFLRDACSDYSFIIHIILTLA